MAFRERMEWTMHMGLLVFILAAAAFLSALSPHNPHRDSQQTGSTSQSGWPES